MINTNPHAWLLSDLKNIPQNGLKVLSTFSCGGGSTMGYKLAGCDVIGANDIDPEMAYHYKLNHNPKYYYLCPIKELLTVNLPDEFYQLDIFEGSPPCFAKGTPVITSTGVKAIEEIKIGDKVLTHKGRWKSVINTNTRFSETILVDNRIEVTPEHRFYGRDISEKLNKQREVHSLLEPRWIEAKDCQGKFLGLPIEIEHLPLPDAPEGFIYNDAFWYFVGRWLGDGWVRYETGSDEPYKYRERYVATQKPCLVCGKPSRKNTRTGCENWWTNYCSQQCRLIENRKRKRPKYEVLICSSFEEADSLYLKLIELNVKIGRRVERTTERFRISSKSLVLWLLENFGRYADGKNLPGFVYSMSPNWKNNLLQGYIDADGFVAGNITKLTTVGRNLLCGLMQLAVSMGYSINVLKKIANNGVIEGRQVNCKQSYSLAITNNNRYVDDYENIQWRKLRREIKPASEITQVYDIEVKDDHSFIADGFIVHNCSSFSIAGNREKDWGKKKHFREGQTKQILDDLFFDFLDLAERLNPKVIIAENVKGLILGKARGYVKMIMNRFIEIGYRPQLFLVNAADCGVPQCRERVFFVALRNDIEKPLLTLNPNKKWVSCGEATDDIQVLTDDEIRNTKPTGIDLKYWHLTKNGRTYEEAYIKLRGKLGAFNHYKLDNKKPSNTLIANHPCLKHWDKCRTLTFREWKRLGSFPDDYQAKTDNIGKYMIGMSVPPKMTYEVAKAVVEQWFS